MTCSTDSGMYASHVVKGVEPRPTSLASATEPPPNDVCAGNSGHSAVVATLSRTPGRCAHSGSYVDVNTPTCATPH